MKIKKAVTTLDVLGMEIKIAERGDMSILILVLAPMEFGILHHRR
jgi:hypothetical protein